MNKDKTEENQRRLPSLAREKRRRRYKSGTGKQNILIKVTTRIVNDAIRSHSGHCMIAEALKESLGELGVNGGRVSVDLQTIRYTDLDNDVRFVYLTPPVAQAALVRFDKGAEIRPFRFMLSRDRAVQVIPTAKRIRKAKLKVYSSARTGSGKNRTRTIRVVGGEPPPRGALASGGHFQGKRRSYGMRTLDFGQSDLEDRMDAETKRSQPKQKELFNENA